MDEDIELPKVSIDPNAKKAIDNELANFLKPKSEQKIIENVETVARAVASEKNLPINMLAEAPIQPKSGTNIMPAKRPIIRTFKGDMEETIQTGHLSSINIAVSENKKLFNQIATETEEGKKWSINKNILIISSVLVIGGILTFIIPHFLVQQSNTTQEPIDVVLSHALITTDLEERINVATINLSRVATTLQERVQQSSTQLGQIKNIILTQGSSTGEQKITSDQFLKLIAAHVPADVERALRSDYMFGTHNFNGNQDFVIIKISDYAAAFSGMLSWEDTLWQDFSELFALKDAPIVDTSLFTGTSSARETNTDSINSSIIQVKKFQDASFANKDCRVVKDATGKIVFLYSIVDNNTIVITTSTDTLKELVSRLNQANSVQ